MRWSDRIVGIVLVGAVLGVSATAFALPQFARETKAACAACHANPAGGADLTDAGKGYKTEKKSPTGEAPVAEYVGVNKCRACHISQFKSWQASKHAKAFGMLKATSPEQLTAMAAALNVEVKGDPSTDDNCVVCHVTGFQLPGGFPGADSTKHAALSNVTCENCHGPGSKHVSAATADKKKFINRGAGAMLCAGCHTAAMSPAFKFEEYKAKIVHWKTK
jgi:predicted CXXCH cytochrome family protein